MTRLLLEIWQPLLDALEVLMDFGVRRDTQHHPTAERFTIQSIILHLSVLLDIYFYFGLMVRLGAPGVFSPNHSCRQVCSIIASCLFAQVHSQSIIGGTCNQRPQRDFVLSNQSNISPRVTRTISICILKRARIDPQGMVTMKGKELNPFKRGNLESGHV